MTLEQYISYFENLAKMSRDIAHNPAAGRESFFVVENPFDLSAIDNAIRDTLQLPALLLDIPDLDPSDNGSANFTEQIDGTFAIVKENQGDRSLVQSECLEIAKKFLFRMLKDSKERKIDPGKRVHLSLSDSQYTPIGPIAANYYGYLIAFRFTATFGPAVRAEDWQDL